MTPQPYSEVDTRQHVIDARLHLAGWDVNDPTQVIQELDIYVGEGASGAVRERRPEYAGHRFADYGLLLRGRAAGEVKAKKTSRDAQVGQEQALQFAQRLQRMERGAIPFVMYTNGYDTFFWDSEFYPPAKVPSSASHPGIVLPYTETIGPAMRRRAAIAAAASRRFAVGVDRVPNGGYDARHGGSAEHT